MGIRLKRALTAPKRGKSVTKTIKWDGVPIAKPGLYSNIALELYHSAKICDGVSVSSSGLRKIFNESAAHYWAESPLNPNRVEGPEKPHYVLGRAVHHLMLGEPFFAKLFAIQSLELPDEDGVLKPWQGNRKVCKAWLRQTRESGRAVLTPADVENIKGMAGVLGRHPLIRAGALNGQIERSGFWKDKKTGVWLKIRPDSIPTSDGDYVDLKTCLSVQWEDLVRSIGEYAYHQQFSLIRTVARELGLPFHSATLVFVEKTAPYCTRVVTVKDNDLDLGEKQNKAALDIFADCIKSGNWPGPGGDREDAEWIEIGTRARERVETKLTILGAG